MIGKLFGKKKTVTSAEIGEQIGRTDTELRELRSKFGPLALNAAQGIEGADKEITALERQIEEAQTQRRQLEGAYAVALEQEARAEQRARAKMYAAKLRDVQQHLAARDASAQALSAAIAEAVKHYRAMVEQSTLAIEASPAKWPTGSGCELGILRRQVEVELFRLSGDGTLTGSMNFPGAQHHDLSKALNPAGLPALPDVLSKASVHTVAMLQAEWEKIAAELAVAQ